MLVGPLICSAGVEGCNGRAENRDAALDEVVDDARFERAAAPCKTILRPEDRRSRLGCFALNTALVAICI